MWKIAVVCAALLAFGGPTLAQYTALPPAPPPPPSNDQCDQSDQSDRCGVLGLSPGMLIVVAAGGALLAFGVYEASKKPVSP